MKVSARLISFAFLPLLAFPVRAAEMTAPSGHPAFQSGVLSDSLPGNIRDGARRWVLSRATDLGIPPTSTLGPAKVHSTRFGASVRFAQQVAGVDIEGAQVVVTLDALKRVVQLSSSVFPYTSAATEWKLSPEEALGRASRAVVHAVSDDQGRRQGSVRRAVFRVGTSARAGYLAHVVTLHRTENWHVGVDAATGEILWQRDLKFSLNEADVYPRSPGGKGQVIGDTTPQRVTLEHLPANRQGGHLIGTHIVSVNCCPSKGCQVGASPKRATGFIDGSNGQRFPYDVAVCDQTYGASITTSGTQDYLYTPTDPPKTPQPSQSDAADSDLFAQVQAYYQVNAIYDFIRALSTAPGGAIPGETQTPFAMRDVERGKLPVVATNVVTPNRSELLSEKNVDSIRADTLERVDNAAFMPRESATPSEDNDAYFVQYTTPVEDGDSLVIYQGNDADFAYDGSVLWHEFVHGVIHSTAKLEFSLAALDAHSANGEGGALHEGIADYFAAAFGEKSQIGEYVGSRVATYSGSGSGFIRDINNTAKCPDVLWGEVHQDSLHVSGALWEARKSLFPGAEPSSTFDAAVYGALVSLTPDADFARFAEAVVNQVKLAFPALPGAEESMRQVFTKRGVIGCSKVVDYKGPARTSPVYLVSSPMDAGLSPSTYLPGPYQFRLKAINKVGKVVLTGRMEGGFGEDENDTSTPIQVLVKAGGPVTFTRSADALTHDATAGALMTLQGSAARASVDFTAEPGTDIYVSITANRRGALLYVPALALEEPAPPPAAQPTYKPDEDAGCGCMGGVGVAGAPLALALWALFTARRRSRR